TRPLTSRSRAYQALTELSPDYASGHYHLANIERRDGDLTRALAGYQRAQELAPGDYRAFLQAALIHHRAGRGGEVVPLARKVLEIGPRRERDRKMAESLLDRWRDSEPGRSDSIR
ncbi:MAG: hypothetical protein AAGC55_03430, partial [Myxococcota bacterium]